MLKLNLRQNPKCGFKVGGKASGIARNAARQGTVPIIVLVPAVPL
jgi:hypothetical protein